MGTKSRDYAGVNTVNNARVGNLPAARGKFLLLVDDIAYTCGTVEKIIRVMADKEDIKGVVVVVSHALLSGNGVSVLDGLYKEGLLLNFITTDSVPRRPEFADAHPWYVEVSLSPRIARYVYSMYMDRSVSDVHLEDD